MNLTTRYGNHTREPYEYIDVEFDTTFIDDPAIMTVYFHDGMWGNKPPGMHWKWEELNAVAQYIYDMLYKDAGDRGLPMRVIRIELEGLAAVAMMIRKCREVMYPGINI